MRYKILFNLKAINRVLINFSTQLYTITFILFSELKLCKKILLWDIALFFVINMIITLYKIFLYIFISKVFNKFSILLDTMFSETPILIKTKLFILFFI